MTSGMNSDEFGYGIGIGLDTTAFTKAVKVITDGTMKISKKVIDANTQFIRNQEEVSKVNEEYGKKIESIFSKTGNWLNTAKFKLGGLIAAAADLAVLDTEFTKFSTSSNLVAESGTALMDSAMNLSDTLGVSIRSVKSAYEAMGDYGKSILLNKGFMSSYSQETIATAIKAQEAWNMPLGETISLLDDLNKYFSMSHIRSRKFLETLKGISKVTGTSTKSLIDLNKQLIDVYKSSGRSFSSNDLLRASRYAGVLDQMGGNVGQLQQIYSDIQNEFTVGKQTGLLGMLGLDAWSLRSMDFGDFGKAITEKLNKAMPWQQGQLAESFGFDIALQEAMKRAFDRDLELPKDPTSDLDKDFGRVMSSLGMEFKQFAVEFEKFYLRTLKPLLISMKPILQDLISLLKQFTKWYTGLSDNGKKITALGLALGFLIGPLNILKFLLTKGPVAWFFKGNWVLTKNIVGVLKVLPSLKNGLIGLRMAFMGFKAVTPFGWVLLAVDAFLLLLPLLKKFDISWDGLKNVLKGTMEFFKGFVDFIKDSVVGVFNWLGDTMGKLMHGLAMMVEKGWKTAGDIFEGMNIGGKSTSTPSRSKTTPLPNLLSLYNGATGKLEYNIKKKDFEDQSTGTKSLIDYAAKQLTELIQIKYSVAAMVDKMGVRLEQETGKINTTMSQVLGIALTTQ